MSKQWTDFIDALKKKEQASSRDSDLASYDEARNKGVLNLEAGVRIEQGKDGNAIGVVAKEANSVVDGVNKIVAEFKKADITAVHIYLRSTPNSNTDVQDRMQVIENALSQGVMPILISRGHADFDGH